jgi:hypothetical protein
LQRRHRRRPQQFRERPAIDQQRIGAGPAFRPLDPEPGGGIALWIEVEEQNLVLRRQDGGEVDRGRGFADATFLVGEGDDAGAGPVRWGSRQDESR